MTDRPILFARNWSLPIVKGDKGSDVMGLQTFLVLSGYDLGSYGDRKNGVDGDFGNATANAVVAFRSRVGLTKEAVVDAAFVKAMTGKAPSVVQKPEPEVELFPIRFIQAKNFTVGRYGKKITHIVVHSMEAGEHSSTAENVSNWFASSNAPRASIHYNVDDDSVVQCVKDEHIAWHAPGLNSVSLGIEHAGYARQTEAEWLDDYGKRMLTRSAKLCGQLCAKYGIPVRFVDQNDLKAGKAGITSHHEVSKAFKKSDHWDPGPGFPFEWWLQIVREEVAKVTS